MKKNYASLLLILLWSLNSFAQIHINEYSASNLEFFLDNYGKTEDWIELYNSSSDPVDLTGWHISDKEAKPQKWAIPTGTIIPGNGHLVFWCSGRDESEGSIFHTNFKLAQTKIGEVVLLSDPSGTIMEMFSMDLTLVEHSRCRSIDGGPDWVVSTEPSLGSSNDSTIQFLGYTQTPSMNLAAGYYSGLQMVSLTNNEPNSVLRYTTDGTNPTETSPIYTDPLPLAFTQVIKAQSFSNDSTILAGKMDFNTYLIDEDFTLAVFSVAADSVLDLAGGNGPVIPIGSLEYFNKNKEREATSFGSLNRHGQDSWVLPHRSLDWVSRDEMGYSKAVNAPLFNYSNRDEYQKFMFRNSGDDNYPAINDNAHQGSTHIRDEYVQTLALDGGMALDTRAAERVILFLNGQYWGVYGMRERPVDHDYTDEYYDQGKYDLQYLSTWGNTEIEYGGTKAMTDWMALRDFILENDMSDSANYQIANDSINMVSLIDYMIVNLNVVASDWLNYNTGWWRGLDTAGQHKKWGYILWDLDATFDYYINYSGVPNISPDAEPCDLEDISDFMDGFFGSGGGTSTLPANCQTIINGGSPYPATDTFFIQTILQDGYCCDNDWDGICQDLYDDIASGNNLPSDGDVGQHEKIFLKLLEENSIFKQLYYSRYADMMNTVFSCNNMIYTLDSMLAVIEPEMPKQIQRWGGTLTELESNVQDLKDFILSRCELLDDGAIGCYDELSGPHNITLLTEPNGIGEIDFNTLDIESFPWTGDYFGGMENKIKAKVFDEFTDTYKFSHWISTAENIITPNDTTRKAWINLTQADTLIAIFETILVGDTNMENDFNISVFPNPAKDYLILKYNLKKTSNVKVSLHSVLGQQIIDFTEVNQKQPEGFHLKNLSLDSMELTTGLYFLVVQIEDELRSFKINIAR